MIVYHLAQLLKRKKWSLYRLRQESGVSYPTLLSLFHDTSGMYRADVLDKLCRTLGCQVGDLLKWEPGKKPKRKKRPR
jgi:putative transcriptional regulator